MEHSFILLPSFRISPMFNQLIVSFFDTAMDGTVTERSRRITLPVETSLRSE